MTVEELEARLETVNLERDDLKKRLLDMFFERNDVRDKLDICAFDLVTAKRERDDARTQLAMVEAWHKQMCSSAERGWAQEAERTRERDEALAELAFIRAEYANARNEELTEDALALKIAALVQERDEARADVDMLEDRLSESRVEAQRLTDERDELLVRVAEQGAELRATREAYADAYRRGVEAMREAWCRTRLPIPEEP